MKYKKIVTGKFIDRPNRFIANVEIDGILHTVHVKNTGRCKELLIPGTKVYLSESDNSARKTKYDLIAVYKNDLLVNIDSQAPNAVTKEWLLSSGLFSQNAKIKSEAKYKNSRFDFYIEDENKKAFLEVKGVTLEKNGVALFPDAPTERGVKHIKELVECKKQGYDAYILFVIQMKEIETFTPNVETHKEFADTLKQANLEGVNILAYDCVVTKNSLKIDKPIKIVLSSL